MAAQQYPQAFLTWATNLGVNLNNAAATQNAYLNWLAAGSPGSTTSGGAGNSGPVRDGMQTDSFGNTVQNANSGPNGIIVGPSMRPPRGGLIYTTFNSVDDILPNNVDTVTKGLFSCNSGSMLSFYTSSLETSIQNTYYREIYTGDCNCGGPGTEPQFSIAYGNYAGSGSVDLTGNLNNDTPSRAIYAQWAQTLLNPTDYKFTINGRDTDNIYVLNFNRARWREKIDPGNLEINLAYLSGSLYANNVHTGSNVRVNSANAVLRLIDDSSTTLGTIGEAGRVYNIVSGTIDGGATLFNPSAPQYFGLFYPDYGVVVLDGDRLNLSASFNTTTGSQVQGDNAMKMYTSLSGSGAISSTTTFNYGIQARSSEQVKSTYYFVRVKNAEYNYTNNPSFTTGSYGDLKYATFFQDPQVYITTVGLYNTNKELLAVAKLSKPILKSFTREALIKVKLDF